MKARSSLGFAAGSTFAALGFAFAAAGFVIAPACTTRETGTIELSASADPRPPPAPKGMTPPCSGVEDCPGDPKHRLCRVEDGLCVECLFDVDCSDPQRPRCDGKGNCAECRPEDEARCPDAAPDATPPR